MDDSLNISYRKLDKNAKDPQKNIKTDAGYDLTAISVKYTQNYIEYGTGIAFNIPENYVGLLFPRSSVTKMDLTLKNSVGVVDSGFLGEIKFRFLNLYKNDDLFLSKDENLFISSKPKHYDVGERIGQIVFLELPYVFLNEVNEFQETERGTKGWGSSGNKQY